MQPSLSQRSGSSHSWLHCQMSSTLVRSPKALPKSQSSSSGSQSVPSAEEGETSSGNTSGRRRGELARLREQHRLTDEQRQSIVDAIDPAGRSEHNSKSRGEGDVGRNLTRASHFGMAKCARIISAYLRSTPESSASAQQHGRQGQGKQKQRRAQRRMQSGKIDGARWCMGGRRAHMKNINIASGMLMRPRARFCARARRSLSARSAQIRARATRLFSARAADAHLMPPQARGQAAGGHSRSPHHLRGFPHVLLLGVVLPRGAVLVHTAHVVKVGLDALFRHRTPAARGPSVNHGSMGSQRARAGAEDPRSARRPLSHRRQPARRARDRTARLTGQRREAGGENALRARCSRASGPLWFRPTVFSRSAALVLLHSCVGGCGRGQAAEPPAGAAQADWRSSMSLRAAFCGPERRRVVDLPKGDPPSRQSYINLVHGPWGNGEIFPMHIARSASPCTSG